MAECRLRREIDSDKWRSRGCLRILSFKSIGAGAACLIEFYGDKSTD